MEIQDSDSNEDSSIEIYPIEESLHKLIQELEQIQSDPIEELIQASLVTSFADASYLESGTISATSIQCVPAVATFCKKETITFTDYFKLLTSYVIEYHCVDTQGVITPNMYLQSIFGITQPCTILQFLNLTTG
jgi:hypothetical protein